MGKKTVLLILVDGMRHDYINADDSPFLHALAKQNIDAIVRETFAFELRPAFFAGLQPEECGVANMFCYDPANSPFRSIDIRDGDRSRITQELRSEAGNRGYSLVKYVGGCAEIPLELLKYFDFSEKYHTIDPGTIPGHKTVFDFLRDKGKKWLWIGYPDGPNTTDGVLSQFFSKVTGEEDLVYLHFSELDWVGHEAGPHSEKQKKTLTEIDEAIRKIFCRLNQSFAEVRSIIFGDHGQVEIKKNIDIEAGLKKTGLILEKDYLYFLDSTQARFWFFNDVAREKVVELLRAIPDGRMLTQTDHEKLHNRFKNNKFGELIFVVNDGVGIFPNFFQRDNPCKGLHGYLPEVEANWGKLIIAGCGINKKITTPVEMTSLFPTLLELLSGGKPVASKTKSVFDLAHMRPVQEKYKLSVVVPTWNRLKTLKKCLLALEKQDYPRKDFELIVINDGSSDGTDNFLKKYQTKTTMNFKYFNQVNGGPAAARNIGIKYSEGHVIILIGDDIITEPDFLKNHTAFHQEHQPISHACLGFIDWSKDIKKTTLMNLITSKDGGQQFCWHLIESQDRDNVDWGMFWSSHISFKRVFSLTHGLFNEKIFKHAMWEDVELGHRLHQAGLVLHFRKNYRVYHDHAITFQEFIKRQKLVGWYSRDLNDLEMPVGYHLQEYEKSRIYSQKILDEICAIMPSFIGDPKRYAANDLKNVYNFCFRYAALVGLAERKGELGEKFRGSVGLLFNLAFAERELVERIGQIVSLNQALAGRDAQIVDLNRAVADREKKIVDLSQAVTERNSTIEAYKLQAEQFDLQLRAASGQIVDLNQAVAERDGKIVNLNQTIDERDAQITGLRQSLIERNSELGAARDELHRIYTSKKWKIITKVAYMVSKWASGKFFWQPIKKLSALCRPRSDADYIRCSGVFDAKWYLATYRDVADAKLDPLWHYLNFGTAEGRQPGLKFDGDWYLQQYPDVAGTGMNPLVHYSRYGKKAGLKPMASATVRNEKRAVPCSPAFYPPGISIIIPTYNGGKLFKRVLDAIADQKFPGDKELIVIDSNSNDGTDKLAESYEAIVKRIPKKEFHHSRTRQWARSFARYDRIVYMVQDATPIDKNWLKTLRDVLDQDVVAVYGRQVPYEDADFYARFEAESHNKYLGGFPRIQGFPSKVKGVPYHQALYECRFDNACAIYWHKALDNVSFPDIPYAEDMAWARKVFEQGMRIRYSPKVQIRHSHNRPAIYRFKRAIVDTVACAQILNQLQQDLRPAGVAEITALEEFCERLVDVKMQAADSDNCLRKAFLKSFFMKDILAEKLCRMSKMGHQIACEMDRQATSLFRVIAKRYPNATKAELQSCIPQVIYLSQGVMVGMIYASYLLKGKVPADLEKLIRPLMAGV